MTHAARLAALAVALAAVACSGKTEPAPASRTEAAPVRTPPPAQVSVAPAAPAAESTAPAAPAEPAPAGTSAGSKAPTTAAPAKEMAAPTVAPAAPAPPVKEPARAAAPAPTTAPPPAPPTSGKVEAQPSPAAAAPAKIAPEKSQHAAVGAGKCRMCHRVQFESWSASPHAAQGLDCEGCHGNGADYMKASVMRDRAAAVAAGLVLPDVAACRECHAGVDASFLAKAHAHKAR